ncbi:hypothetical protein AAFF_G00041490 [Aldrovandia affinis]|uniref:Uncharacterized protein n=1 Tax=Aldrovandia affinis TaxID=143900 RepID=A0AAD7S2I1_9TELE|nr:hypothetical protein AAFF_G00041490 [Aldrovandia affinis]
MPSEGGIIRLQREAREQGKAASAQLENVDIPSPQNDGTWRSKMRSGVKCGLALCAETKTGVFLLYEVGEEIRDYPPCCSISLLHRGRLSSRDYTCK